MEATGSATVGGLLATLNPHEERRRAKYLGRPMIREEFEAIWARQKEHHPSALSNQLHDNLTNAIFYQRPLKSQKDKVGDCTLEPKDSGAKRAPRALWIAQEVRMMQEVNNLRVWTYGGKERMLTPEERTRIIARLRTIKSEAKFDSIKKWIKLDERDSFNLQEGKRPGIKPQLVEVTLREQFPDMWENTRDVLIEQLWRSFVELEPAEFEREAAAKSWNISADQLRELGRLYAKAGDGYAAYSERAMHRLLPHLQAGLDMYEARKMEYPESTQEKMVDFLPPIDAENITNPVVKRSVSETRKVVNAIIRTYGKPKRIVVELAREARGSIADRNESSKENRRNEKEREKIREELIKFNVHPSSEAIRKFRLWKECREECVYTKKPISFAQLFGENPEFDIEHIIPYSRSYDNGLGNVTLCCKTENRQNKHNRTPYEAYSSDPERMGDIKSRVWKSLMPIHKKRNFFRQELEEGFQNRQLTDTSYAARELRSMLRQLGVPVETTKGPVVADLRHFLGLNTVLAAPEDEKIRRAKDRGDHRHHAIDAITIATVTPKATHHLGKRFDVFGERPEIPPPWDGYPIATFRNHVERVVKSIIVSHRPNHKLAGCFSKETNYGKINVPSNGKTGAAGKNSVFVTRDRLDMKKEIDEKFLASICDATVADTIRKHLLTLGLDTKAGKVTLPEGWMKELRMPAKNGQGPSIKKVRTWAEATFRIPIPIERPIRYVESGSNHHLAFYLCSSSTGEPTLAAETCSRFEAMHRHQNGQSIVRTKNSNGGTLALHLMNGDMVRYIFDDGTAGLFVTESISAPPTAPKLWALFRHFTDSLGDDRKLPKALLLQSTGKLLFDGKLRIEKVVADPLGRLSIVNDTPHD